MVWNLSRCKGGPQVFGGHGTHRGQRELVHGPDLVAPDRAGGKELDEACGQISVRKIGNALQRVPERHVNLPPRVGAHPWRLRNGDRFHPAGPCRDEREDYRRRPRMADQVDLPGWEPADETGKRVNRARDRPLTRREAF
jgi:hypothetical protein